jgi:hypothetical protein
MRGGGGGLNYAAQHTIHTFQEEQHAIYAVEKKSYASVS